MTAIVTDRLTKQYGTSRGCRDVTLTVKPGQVFGLLGPNGAGKSTFVKMVAGLLHPTSGEATIMGYPAGSVEARRLFGYLPELFRFPDWLTAAEVLEFHAGLGGATPRSVKERIQDHLREVGLSGKENQRVKSFSKGMQQRLGMASALLFDPPLLILDEPASALDPIGRHEIRLLLQQLKERGKTVFLNTHLLEDVELLCDEVAFLHEGQLLASGSLSELLGGGEIWTFSVGGWDPDAEWVGEAAAAGIRLTVVEEKENGEAHLTAASLHPEQAGWVNAKIIGSGMTLYETKKEKSHLEDWFLSMVRGEGGGFS
ncbi:ABC transporter ATP-binding protein [Gorillibacterium massiliense]|uniref:ABC transporter ATP-binding protein n=1 Tax=Gorillibacterium massiliense TaxID=1280390 RepID=UPI0004AF5A60|nr:ABC transporter ATP-binding protein [Gorillibacterium massiliense]